MDNVIDYKIVLNDSVDLNEMETEVKNQIKEGWQPLGSPFLSGKDNSYMTQAMVMYEKK